MGRTTQRAHRLAPRVHACGPPTCSLVLCPPGTCRRPYSADGVPNPDPWPPCSSLLGRRDEQTSLLCSDSHGRPPPYVNPERSSRAWFRMPANAVQQASPGDAGWVPQGNKSVISQSCDIRSLLSGHQTQGSAERAASLPCSSCKHSQKTSYNCTASGGSRGAIRGGMRHAVTKMLPVQQRSKSRLLTGARVLSYHLLL